MSTLNKPKQVRIRLSQADGETIDRIKGVLSETDVASFVLAAGLQAIRESGERFAYPLRLAVGGAEEQRREREAPLPKRKAA